jgi:hypothetical protein
LPGTYPQYQISELERIARRLLEERFPEDVSIPVDIDYLAESEPGVSLDIMPGLRHKFGIAGAVVVHAEERQFTILIDQSVADGNAAFYRFTLAEEFSHLVLHRSVLEQIKTLEDAARLHASPAYYDHLDRNAKWHPHYSCRSPLCERTPRCHLLDFEQQRTMNGLLHTSLRSA